MIDLFGLNFNFRIFNKSKYHTFVSLALSLIVIAITIFFIVDLGLDFFKQINPILSQTEVHPESHRYYNLTSNNFTIAWRFEDNSRKPIKVDDILFPKFTSTESIKRTPTEKDKRTVIRKELDIESKPCVVGDNLKDKIFINQITPNEVKNWNCLNLDSRTLKLGGLSQVTDYYDIIFRLHFCPEGDFYSSKCAPYLVLKDLLYTKNIFFSILVPIFYYDLKPEPESKENPLKYEYKNIRIMPNMYVIRFDKLNFQEVILNNDRGIIFDEPVKKTTLYYQSTDTDFVSLLDESWVLYETNKKYAEDNIWDSILTVRYIFEKNFIQANLKYLKAQDLAAKVGGLMSVLMAIGLVISDFFNEYYLNQNLINEYFEFSSSDYDKFKKVKTLEDNVIESLVDKDEFVFRNNKKTTTNKISKCQIDEIKNMIKEEENNGCDPLSNACLEIKLENVGNYSLYNIKNSNNKKKKSSFGKQTNNCSSPEKLSNLTVKVIEKDLDLIRDNIFIDSSKIEKNDYMISKDKKDLVFTDSTLSKRDSMSKISKEENFDKVFDPFREKFNKDQVVDERSFTLSLFELLCYYLTKNCCKVDSKKKENIMIFKYANNLVEKMTDIANYIQVQRKLSFLSILTLPKNHQSLCFDMLKKPNLHNKDDLYKMDLVEFTSDKNDKMNEVSQRQKIDVMKYFAQNFNKLNSIEKDGLIYDMLDPQYKLFIIDAAKVIHLGKEVPQQKASTDKLSPSDTEVELNKI